MVSTPQYERYKHPLKEGQTVSHVEMESNMLIPSNLHAYFLCNYDGSTGSMESNVMLWMIKMLYIVMGGWVYYTYVVRDDETSMRKYLTHPETGPTFKKHIDGYLSK